MNLEYPSIWDTKEQTLARAVFQALGDQSTKGFGQFDPEEADESYRHSDDWYADRGVGPPWYQ